MVLIKSFLTGVWYDSFRLTCAYSDEREEVRERYSCLKMIVQPHLHFDFFTIVFIKRALRKQFYLNVHYLSGSIYNLQFKKCNCNSTHSCNRKIWVDTPSYIIFPYYNHSRYILIRLSFIQYNLPLKHRYNKHFIQN